MQKMHICSYEHLHIKLDAVYKQLYGMCAHMCNLYVFENVFMNAPILLKRFN